MFKILTKICIIYMRCQTIQKVFMKYKILCVGKIKEKFYRDEIEGLLGLIRKKGNVVDIIELQDLKIPDNMKSSSVEAFLEKECCHMFDKINGNDYVIALCVEGMEITTSKHRIIKDKAYDMGKESITYIIGGSLGLPEKIKKRADVKMSFSKLTFPHQLMRMVLLEEISHL